MPADNTVEPSLNGHSLRGTSGEPQRATDQTEHRGDIGRQHAKGTLIAAAVVH